MPLLVDGHIHSHFKAGAKRYKETSTEENSIVNDHCSHFPIIFSVNIKDHKEKLRTMYWLPKHHKNMLSTIYFHI